MRIDFIIDTKDKKDVSQNEAAKLIRYFLAGLTIPEKDLWVNLSPYEKERIVPNELGQTELGRELLEQDYILKQFSASLTHPGTKLGKEYWKYLEGQHVGLSQQQDNFSKIWIVPGEVEVWEHENVAFVNRAELQAKTESDYFALQTNLGTDLGSVQKEGTRKRGQGQALSVLIDKVTNEVNNGENFAELRQVYNSLILAMWFKQKFEQSFYKYYFQQSKISGIDLEDEAIKHKIWQLYVQSFEKGVYNFTSKVSGQSLGKIDGSSPSNSRRRFFSGGQNYTNLNQAVASSMVLAPIPLLAAGIKGMHRLSANLRVKSFKEEEIARIKKQNYEDYSRMEKELDEVAEDVFVGAADASKLGTMNFNDGRKFTTVRANKMRQIFSVWLSKHKKIVGKEPGENSDEFWPVARGLTRAEFTLACDELNFQLDRAFLDYRRIELSQNLDESVVEELRRLDKENVLYFYSQKNFSTINYDRKNKRAVKELTRLGIDVTKQVRSSVPFLYMGIYHLKKEKIHENLDTGIGIARVISEIASMADIAGEQNKNDEDRKKHIVFYDDIQVKSVKYKVMPGVTDSLIRKTLKATHTRVRNLRTVQVKRSRSNADIQKRSKRLGAKSEPLKQIFDIDKKTGVYSRFSLAKMMWRLIFNYTKGNRYLITRAPPNEFLIARRTRLGKGKPRSVNDIELFYFDDLFAELPNSTQDIFAASSRPSNRRIDRVLSPGGKPRMFHGVKIMNGTFGKDQTDHYIRFKAGLIKKLFKDYAGREIPSSAIRAMSGELNKAFPGFNTVQTMNRISLRDILKMENDYVKEVLGIDKPGQVVIEDIGEEQALILAGLLIDRLTQLNEARSTIKKDSLVYAGDNSRSPDIVKDYIDYIDENTWQQVSENNEDMLARKMRESRGILKVSDEMNFKLVDKATVVNGVKSLVSVGSSSSSVERIELDVVSTNGIAKPFTAETIMLTGKGVTDGDMLEHMAYRQLDYLLKFLHGRQQDGLFSKFLRFFFKTKIDR